MPCAPKQFSNSLYYSTVLMTLVLGLIMNFSFDSANRVIPG